ncbi:MAG: glycosyl hydrolase family 18 protein [Pirellulaceae bacterium]
MNRLALINKLLMLVLCCGHAVGEHPRPLIVGYLPNYRTAEWSKQIGPMTDLILFGMSAPTDGVFDPSEVSRQQLALLRQIKSNSRCRVLFTVGGWNKSDGFAALTSDPELRNRFIRDARRFCVEHRFDGIDYDWEHPNGAKQVEAYTELIVQTHAQFADDQLLVTVAQAGWQDLGPMAYQAVDRIHLMAYDHDFPQATFEKAQADVNRLLSAGCPRTKIVLGVPFYGRNKAGDARTFAQLAASPSFQENVAVVDGFALNGPSLISRKAKYVNEQGLGGIMIWEIGQDAVGSKSLLNVLGVTLQQ